MRQAPAPIGVLLTNLGSPEAPTAGTVRRYLRQLLSDRRVVELPRARWWLILNLLVLPIRAPRSARLYRSIWTDEGSPLVVTTRLQARSLASLLEQHHPSRFRVVAAMRYGRPSIQASLAQLARISHQLPAAADDARRPAAFSRLGVLDVPSSTPPHPSGRKHHRTRHLAALATKPGETCGPGCRRILVLPLYPQYSATTTASVADAVAEALRTWRHLPDLRLVHGYHKDPGYIRTLASSVTDWWRHNGRGERLLISCHGLPQRHADDGDPYPDRCQASARLLVAELGLEPDQWALAYQSRFGRGQWLEPSTAATVERWAREGLASVDVICPGFAADCLETLEEIAVEARELFVRAGGERLAYIPALNDRADHIQALADIVVAHSAGWL